jgi:hypothetical protein
MGYQIANNVVYKLACYSRSTMRRSIRIAATLAGVALLALPFDCFGSCTPDPKAMDCCLKGNCAPTAKSDECCKNNTSEGKALVLSKAANDSTYLLAQAAVRISVPLPTAGCASVANPLKHPPPAGLAGLKLPLLI